MPLFESIEKLQSLNETDNIKYINNIYTTVKNEYILYLTCNWYPSHSHIMQDLFWQFSYFFELKEKYNNLLLILDSNNIHKEYEINTTNGLSVDSIKYLLNILNIPHLFLNNIQLSNIKQNSLYLCNKLFHIPSLRHYQHDLDDDDMNNFDEKIFLYKNMCLLNNSLKYQVNFNFKNNVNKRLNDLMDLYLINMSKNNSLNETLNENTNDSIYFSRRLDMNKFYHMENINEISNLINEKYKAKEITKLWNVSTKEKINYLYNCKRFIIELSTAAIYAFFCKKHTEIIIIASDNNIIQYPGILRSIKNRFKNFSLIKGYDLCINYQHCNFYNTPTPANYVLPNCITCPILFHVETKNNNLINNKFINDNFKYFGKKNICLYSQKPSKMLSFKWPDGDLGHYGYTIEINNNIEKTHMEYKEIDVYEFIGSCLYNNNNDNIESKIARNKINRRFLMLNDEFNKIIETFQNMNIYFLIITCDIWHNLKYIIKPDQI